MFSYSTKSIVQKMLMDLVIGVRLNEIKGYSDIKKLIDANKEINSKRTRESMRIAKIIEKEGIPRYLGLDREETIKRLTKKYANRKQGIGLLMELLQRKYEGKEL